MQLFPDIDDKKTKQNARNLLKKYRRLQRIAGTPQFNITSPIIKEVPIQHANTHRSQQHFIRKIDAEKEKLKIDNALARLSLINRQLLYYTYCSIEKKTNVWIASELGYSVSNVETLKCVALLEFAEAYESGLLQCYKSAID